MSVHNEGVYALGPEAAPRRVILAFREAFQFMSNFTPCHVTLPAERGLAAMEFDTVEQAYMAWKTEDPALRAAIQSMPPGDAKKFAHEPDFPLRKDYNDENRLAIMLDLTRQKYGAQNPDLRAKLLATGDALLIEGNDWDDRFFGFDLKKGCGENHLGRILMRVRQECGGL